MGKITVISALVLMCGVAGAAVYAIDANKPALAIQKTERVAAVDGKPTISSSIDYSITASIAAAPFSVRTNPSDVEIRRDDGLGSGVHIGDGLFLTAAHVVRGVKPGGRIDVKLRDKSLRKAAVLWQSPENDIALLSADGTDVESSKLNCAPVTVGQPITSIGNPLGVESIQAFGRVAGEPRPIGGVEAAFVMDMTVIMGQSGGPVFNMDDEIVGINSMVMMATVAPDGVTGRFAVGYGYAIPSTVICRLLGRAAV